jgi:glutathione gamma-glutamylcysteinyltransferase
MESTLYRRPLPAEAIAFSSAEGRKTFAEALAAGGLDGYFPLAEQFHTQAEPAYCGLGSLVVALNALAIDPGRLWKGPWRWFAEDLLDCCVPLEEVRARGLDLDEVACLARCNGAAVELRRAEPGGLEAWRDALGASARGEAVLIASYDRAALGQSGHGHFSPIGGHHAGRDLALVLDVARFKYPPHWVSATRLFEAMFPVDAVTGKSRGWILLRPRERGAALGFSLQCHGDSWKGLADRRAQTVFDLDAAADIGALARAVAPLFSNLEVRAPSAEPHREALERARAALRALPLWSHVAGVVGSERAEVVALLLLSMAERLSPAQREELFLLGGGAVGDGPLASELENLGAQLAAVLSLR